MYKFLLCLMMLIPVANAHLESSLKCSANGTYGHSIMGSFPDTNDPTRVAKIYFPTGEYCENWKRNDTAGIGTIILSN